MKDRVAFLHFLYIKSSYNEIIKSRVGNAEYDYTRILGVSPAQRTMTLDHIYLSLLNKMPRDLDQIKRVSTFSMSRV